jgi:glycosyltransferase involved in cell wall biosynthesis
MINNKQLKISIITCTYNSQKYLSRALESIESQTYQNIEHIINDGYSTDATLEIIHAYRQRNQHRYPIRLIQSDPKGVGNALNVATQEASGDIIHYLHSDDYYLNLFSLEKITLRFAENPNLVWLTGNFLIEVRGRIFVLPQTYLLKINAKKALSVMNFISHENTFMKREYVQRYGGFCEGPNDVVEYRLWLKLIRDHSPLVVDDEFVVFIVHKGSTSTGSPLKFSKALLRAFHTQRKEKVFPLLGFYADNFIYKKFKTLINA